jgi:anti-sigma regulatory factor (Ser/Thr protein kinase)
LATVLHTSARDEFVHPALFYRGNEEYLEGTVSFIRDGLAAGEPVAVAVPAPNLRLILTQLGTDAERVTSLDMARVGRNPGRIIPGVLRAFVDAHPTERVRIIGQPVWVGRNALEYPACAQHEALINLAFAAHAVTILCPYDVATLDPQVLADVEATHPLLVDIDGERYSPAYAPERIIAEYNQPLPASGAPTITFDITTLPHARRFAVDQAVRFGLGSDCTEFELMAGELIANSVTHGGGSGTLSVWAEAGHLVCEVRDRGHITDPLAGRRPADHYQLSGRGLLLVNYLSDLVRMHTSPEGTTIRLYLELPAQSQDGAGRCGGARATGAPASSRAAPGSAPDQPPLRWQLHDALRAASRFARYLPQEGAVSAEPDAGRRQLRPVLEALAAADVLVQVVELWRARLVQLARHRGARWAEIGRALGVSKQAAHERYGKTRKRRHAVQESPTHRAGEPDMRVG